MANMDHNQAIQLQAAVKYVLGELSQVQRDEYVEHYFDCADCAVDIKALATFADTAREVLRQEMANQFPKRGIPHPGLLLKFMAGLFCYSRRILAGGMRQLSTKLLLRSGPTKDFSCSLISFHLPGFPPISVSCRTHPVASSDNLPSPQRRLNRNCIYRSR